MDSALENKVMNYELTDLKPAHYALINREQRELLGNLEKFQAPYLEEKLLQEGKFSSKKEYVEAFTEFKKYVALNKFSSKPLGMTSKKIDEVWHQFILFTKEYGDFCRYYLGNFLHHSPDTPLTKSSKDFTINFFKAYGETFGDVPKIWKENNEVLNYLAGPDCSSEPAGCSSKCSADACHGTMCSS